LNPNDVSLHVQFGDALARFGLLSEAREQYRMALSVDGALPIDEPKRLSPDQEAELRAKAGLAARLKAAVEGGYPNNGNRGTDGNCRTKNPANTSGPMAR